MWRLGIGQNAGNYHIIDLNTGKIKVEVHSDFTGTVIYKLGTKQVNFPEKIKNVRAWSKLYLQKVGHEMILTRTAQLTKI